MSISDEIKERRNENKDLLLGEGEARIGENSLIIGYERKRSADLERARDHHRSERSDQVTEIPLLSSFSSLHA